jgi:hypothetical protein
VLITTPLNVSLRGTVTKVISVQLTNSEDTFIGKLHRSGFFTVSSMYMWKIQEGVVPNKSPLWNLKVPLKIKIFLWYLLKGVRLTKDNIAKNELASVGTVVLLRLYNIFSVIAIFLNSYGLPCISHLEFNPHLASKICLELGFLSYSQN